MKVKNKIVQKLLEKYKEINLLGKTEAVLGWDLNVNLPQKASEGRAETLAYLTKLLSDKWLDPEFKKLLADANNQKGLSKEEFGIVRNLNWGAKYYHKIPQEIIVEFSRTSSKAFMAWQKAKAENSFKDYEPHLEKMVKLNRLIARHLGSYKNPYDALLDLYEPGLTYGFVEKIFTNLQKELTGILTKIKKSKSYNENFDFVEGDNSFPEDDQKQISLFALRKIGYDFDAGRMDISSHPFTSTLGRYDVRITNRYKSNDFRESLMVALHEGGHALYEQGTNPEFEFSPLDGGVSLGIHESQSRFWENQVGRSSEFISFMTPVFYTLYHSQLGKISEDEIYRSFNKVMPSLIRVEADEVTYNLHIALRLELENALINGKIKVKDLPKIWKEKMKKYLGVISTTDREGVLQDVHWSQGPMGYFPTYTLGNLYAAQFSRKLKKEMQFEELVKTGNLGSILSWLRDNIHKHGSLLWPDELVKKITGEKLNPKYFVDYLKEKYSKIYGF